MIELPGLRGDRALGFLAAMGLVSLSEQGEIPGVRLAWTDESTSIAAVDGEVASVQELSDALREVIDRLRAEGRAIPGVPAELPLTKKGSGSDPMRMSRSEMGKLFEDAERRWLDSSDPWPARWLIALGGQTVAKKRTVKQQTVEEVELSPFYAPTGQMAMRTSIFEKTMEAVDEAGGPGDALTGWRRTSYDGANFEELAKRDAGITTSGKPDNQGAPSPTWLAAMGMRMFPISERNNSTETVRWQRIRLYPGYTQRSFVWLTWKPLLDPPAVRALFAHPDLVVRQTKGEFKLRDPSVLLALGVTGIYGSSRRTLQQGDGPLGPTRTIWRSVS